MEDIIHVVLSVLGQKRPLRQDNDGDKPAMAGTVQIPHDHDHVLCLLQEVVNKPLPLIIVHPESRGAKRGGLLAGSADGDYRPAFRDEGVQDFLEGNRDIDTRRVGCLDVDVFR